MSALSRPRASRRLLPSLVAAASLCSTLSGAALAQSAKGLPGPVVQPAGVEARVYAPMVLEGSPGASPYFVGQLVGADSAGITLHTSSGATVTIPRSYVEQFAVRSGLADRPRSLVQGVLGGAALGLLIGKVSAPPGTGGEGDPTHHVVTASVVGAAAGLAFATFNPWHRWKRGAVPTAVSGATR